MPFYKKNVRKEEKERKKRTSHTSQPELPPRGWSQGFLCWRKPRTQRRPQPGRGQDPRQPLRGGRCPSPSPGPGTGEGGAGRTRQLLALFAAPDAAHTEGAAAGLPCTAPRAHLEPSPALPTSPRLCPGSPCNPRPCFHKPTNTHALLGTCLYPHGILWHLSCLLLVLSNPSLICFSLWAVDQAMEIE